MTDRDQLLDLIETADARIAFTVLEEALRGHGLTTRYRRKGFIRTVNLRDQQDRYLFSWIVNKAHLLFYILKPALRSAPQIATMARANHGERVSTNSAGEIKVRLQDAANARQLADWLVPQIPR